MIKLSSRALVIFVLAGNLAFVNLASVNIGSANASHLKSAATKSRAAKIADLQSLTFKSTLITVNGKLKKLASSDPIRIRFESKSISAKAGCNTLGGAFSLLKGQLLIKKLANTRMACSDALMRQDDWLSKFLISKPKLTILVNSMTSKSSSKFKNYLTMTSGTTAIQMEVYETYGPADTPLGDENSEVLVKKICQQLIADKANESQAQLAAEQNGLLFRVASREGQDFALTMDYRVNRMNVKILGGVVVECAVG